MRVDLRSQRQGQREQQEEEDEWSAVTATSATRNDLPGPAPSKPRALDRFIRPGGERDSDEEGDEEEEAWRSARSRIKSGRARRAPEELPRPNATPAGLPPRGPGKRQGLAAAEASIRLVDPGPKPQGLQGLKLPSLAPATIGPRSAPAAAEADDVEEEEEDVFSSVLEDWKRRKALREEGLELEIRRLQVQGVLGTDAHTAAHEVAAAKAHRTHVVPGLEELD